MKVLSKIANRLVPRLGKKPWRSIAFYFFLLVVSQLVVSAELRNKIRNFFNRNTEVKAQNPSEVIPYAKKPSNWFASLFLAHLADIKPWKGTNIMHRILCERFNWYQAKSGEMLETVRVKLLYDDYIFTKDIDFVRGFHGKEDTLFRNSDTIRRAWGTLFPESMAVTTGRKWKKVRRVFVHAMNKIDLEYLPASTNQILREGFLRHVNEPTQEVPLWTLFAKVTFDSFHKFMYNLNFKTCFGENLEVLQDLMLIATNISDRMLVSIPIIWKLPTKTNRDIYASYNRVINFVDSYIKARYDELKDETYMKDKKYSNFLDALLMTKEDEGEFTQDITDKNVKKSKYRKKLSYDEIRAQLVAVMFGGFDTTTSSLSFICMNLVNHPECQQKLYEEIKDIDLENITKREIDDLPYLNGFVFETLRLNAVAPVLARIPEKDVVVAGRFLKKGTNILLDHYSLGHEPEYWNGQSDLDDFNPERWFNGFQPDKGAFFPFGFGGRHCPGYKVAKLQMKTILAFVVQNFIVSASAKPIVVGSSLGITVTRASTVVLTKR